jgi:type IV pilus assembly protein PilQ
MIRILHAMLRFGSVVSLLCSLMPALAQGQEANSVERIDAQQSGAGLVMAIHLKQPLAAVPASFSISNPARIAIDLPQTDSALGRNAIELNQGDLRSVSVVPVPGRTRIVLNLSRMVDHSILLVGNSVQVQLGQPSTATRFGGTAVAAASAPAAPKEVKSIDFRRGADGEGRVIVDLSDPATDVDIRQQGKRIVVDFIGASAAEALRRRLDVTDFGTPVTMIETAQQGGNVRLTVEPQGLWEQTAYQTDNRFVLEVKPLKQDPNRLVPGSSPGYHGEKLSLNFQNVDIRSLLQVIGDFTNLNIVTSDSVKGNLTLRLKDVPWDQALDIILQAKGLDMRKNGNVLIVAPREEIAVKEKLELEARNQIVDLEPLRTESFTVNYQKADDVRKLLVDDKQRLLSKRGSAVVDVRTNQLFVQDTGPRLDEVRKLIQKVDIPVPQVLIEARIVEASDTFSENLGVRLGGSTGYPSQVAGSSVYSSVGGIGATSSTGPGGAVGTGSTSSTSGGSGNTGAGSGGSSVGGVTTPSLSSSATFVNLPASGLSGYSPAGFGITLFNATLTRFLSLEITALAADGKGKIVSSPRVITADKVKAVIEQGTEIPYQQASTAGNTNVAFRKATLRLEVTPQITPEGAIFLDVKVNKDSVGQQTLSGPAIDTKNVQTQVLVDNGGTVVLGGIYEQTETTTVTKVPWLGDVPVLGYLFKTRSQTSERRELLIFITPRVVTSQVTAGR